LHWHFLIAPPAGDPSFNTGASGEHIQTVTHPLWAIFVLQFLKLTFFLQRILKPTRKWKLTVAIYILERNGLSNIVSRTFHGLSHVREHAFLCGAADASRDTLIISYLEQNELRYICSFDAS
jgi:hypothetical protein